MDKHAYIIIAHNNFKIIEITLSLIDDIRNDIYLLIDKKTNVSDELKHYFVQICKYSMIKILQEQIVNWGGYSQVDAVMKLFKEVNGSGVEYSYVHYMQGSDLPIKSQDDIHRYFSEHCGLEYVMVDQAESQMKIAINKTRYLYFFSNNRYFRKNKLMKCLNFGIVELEKALHIEVNKDITFYHGEALFSITGECVRFILSHEEEIRKRFRFSLAPDEVFMQTMLMNSIFKDKIAENNKEKSFNARLIDRTRPRAKNSPHIWRSEELEYVLSQPEGICFARKFDQNIDLRVAVEIKERILEKA